MSLSPCMAELALRPYEAGAIDLLRGPRVSHVSEAEHLVEFSLKDLEAMVKWNCVR